MDIRLRGVLSVSTSVLSSLVFVGCVVNEPESPARGVIVSGPPPAAVHEARPSPPGVPGTPSVWVAGYWHWTGIQYAWIPGHWDAAPPGTLWSRPVYSSRDGRYFYESGGWRTGQARNALK